MNKSTLGQHEKGSTKCLHYDGIKFESIIEDCPGHVRSLQSLKEMLYQPALVEMVKSANFSDEGSTLELVVGQKEHYRESGCLGYTNAAFFFP